ncbi:hypothetical protein ACFQ6Q_36450 [Streptomyces sp. NPDC056437]|uniref:hypothetical protein n=1 Tax=Streptomyces sp. NPDC056437 TaxID=3345816 RepID=UPI0036B6CF6C
MSRAAFDRHDFPQDLLDAQRHLTALYAQLHAPQARLPWSREAHPGWEEEKERGRQRPGRPATDGWTADEAAEYDRLWAELRTAAAVVDCHPHWGRCREAGTGELAARQALKHADGAAPVARDNVTAAA